MQMILRTFAVLSLLASLLPPLTAAHAAGPNCDAAVEGTILYNRTHKLVQFCNGDQWIGLTAKIGGAGDTLSDLSCTSGQVAEWNGSAWICGAGASGASTVWLNDGPGGPAEIYYNGGNVGIGTNDPESLLDIQQYGTSSSIRYDGDQSHGILLNLREAGTGTYLGAGALGIAGNLSAYSENANAGDVVLRSSSIQVDTSNLILAARGTSGSILFSTNRPDVERMRITTDGNIGIGTPAPLTSLHIQNGGASGKVFSQNTGLIVENNGTASDWFAMQVSTAGANDAFSITNGGNIGIGTSTPVAKVHIATGAVPLMFNETDQTGAGSLWRMPLDGGRIRFDVSQDGTTFSPYNTPLAMSSDGNVAIGALAATTRLQVHGTLRIGDGAELCNVTDHEGAIRYVAATDTFEMCRSSSAGWETLGAGVGAGGGSLTCPPGFTKMESQGNVLGCIQDAAQLAATYNAATSACFDNFGAILPPFGMRVLAALEQSIAVGAEHWIGASGGGATSSYCPTIDSALTGKTRSCSSSYGYHCFIPAGANGTGVGSGTDTLAGLSCTDGQVAAWDGDSWECSTPASGGGSGSSTMIENWPDAIRCYSGTNFAMYYIASSPGFEDWAGTVGYTGSMGGSTDLGATLTFESNGNWKTSTDIQENAIVTNCTGKSITQLQADGQAYNLGGGSGGSGGGSGTDTLAGLSCTDGQVAAWNDAGSVWECATPASGGGGSVFPECKADMSNIQIGDTCDDGSKFLGSHLNFGWQGFYVTDVNQSTSSNWSNAITLCNNLNRHGHADWYLPSKAELHHISEFRNAISGLDSQEYWSSTESDATNAWRMRMDNALATTESKTETNRVRCVRKSAGSGGGGGGSGSDTLAGLSCASGEVAKWNGTAWACAADDAGALADNTVTSEKILDGTITAADTAIIGTLTEGKWCTVSSGKIVCTSDAPGGGGSVPAGTHCGVRYINCSSTSPSYPAAPGADGSQSGRVWWGANAACDSHTIGVSECLRYSYSNGFTTVNVYYPNGTGISCPSGYTGSFIPIGNSIFKLYCTKA